MFGELMAEHVGECEQIAAEHREVLLKQVDEVLFDTLADADLSDAPTEDARSIDGVGDDDMNTDIESDDWLDGEVAINLTDAEPIGDSDDFFEGDE